VGAIAGYTSRCLVSVKFDLVKSNKPDTLSTRPISEIVSGHSAGLDPLAHLARAQALLIYQIIGLYDGDYQLRHVAESHMPVLNRWMRQAVDYASRCDSLRAFLLSPLGAKAGANSVPRERLIWYSWILSESLRRTWLMKSAVHGVYLTSQNGTAHCLGGMMFTSRQGFCEAPSALI